MNNLILFLLGLVLIYIPEGLSQNNDKQCFSQAIKPSYPCCTGNKVVYTDENGDWGVENNKWCGIGSGPSTTSSDYSCFSILLGYNCCKECNVSYTDENGSWGIENNKWCGIKSSCTTTVENEVQYEIIFDPLLNTTDTSNNDFGNDNCKGCQVLFTDERGSWGIENNKFCSIKNSCASMVENVIQHDIMENPIQNTTTTTISNNDLNDFDFLFLKMENNNKENMVYSPLSIKFALKILEEGADKDTYDEINRLLGKNIEFPDSIENDGNLSIVNNLFFKDSYYDSANEEYLNILEEKYYTNVICNMYQNVEDIKGWFETLPHRYEQGRLFGFFGDGKSCGSSVYYQGTTVVMVIANAIFMDMEWVNPFNEYGFYTFQMEDGQKMETRGWFKTEIYNENVAFYKDTDITVLTKDLKEYHGIQLEFMAIMPEKEKLSDFIKNMSKEQIDQIDSKLISSYDEKYILRLIMSSFKFPYFLNLKEDLMKLGVNRAFNDTMADFSKIESTDELYVSDILHRVDIEFTGKGIRTNADNNPSLVVPDIRETEYPTVVIEMLKPYMFIIRDKKTKNIWFTGTVYEPNTGNENLIRGGLH